MPSNGNNLLSGDLVEITLRVYSIRNLPPLFHRSNDSRMIPTDVRNNARIRVQADLRPVRENHLSSFIPINTGDCDWWGKVDSMVRCTAPSSARTSRNNGEVHWPVTSEGGKMVWNVTSRQIRSLKHYSPKLKLYVLATTAIDASALFASTVEMKETQQQKMERIVEPIGWAACDLRDMEVLDEHRDSEQREGTGGTSSRWCRVHGVYGNNECEIMLSLMVIAQPREEKGNIDYLLVSNDSTKSNGDTSFEFAEGAENENRINPNGPSMREKTVLKSDDELVQSLDWRTRGIERESISDEANALPIGNGQDFFVLKVRLEAARNLDLLRVADFAASLPTIAWLSYGWFGVVTQTERFSLFDDKFPAITDSFRIRSSPAELETFLAEHPGLVIHVCTDGVMLGSAVVTLNSLLPLVSQDFSSKRLFQGRFLCRPGVGEIGQTHTNSLLTIENLPHVCVTISIEQESSDTSDVLPTVQQCLPAKKFSAYVMPLDNARTESREAVNSNLSVQPTKYDGSNDGEPCDEHRHKVAGGVFIGSDIHEKQRENTCAQEGKGGSEQEQERHGTNAAQKAKNSSSAKKFLASKETNQSTLTRDKGCEGKLPSQAERHGDPQLCNDWESYEGQQKVESAAALIAKAEADIERRKREWEEWRHREEIKWHGKLRAREAAAMRALQEQVEAREKERANIVEATRLEYGKLENRLKKAIADVETKERKIKNEETCRQAEFAKKMLELQLKERGIREEAKHTFEIERAKTAAALERAAIAEKAAAAANSRAKQTEVDFEEFRQKQRQTPEAELLQEIAILKGKIAEAESRIQKERAEKNHALLEREKYRTNVHKLARALRREREEAAAGARREIEQLRLDFKTGEEHVLDGARNELERIKNDLTALSQTERTTYLRERSGVPASYLSSGGKTPSPSVALPCVQRLSMEQRTVPPPVPTPPPRHPSTTDVVPRSPASVTGVNDIDISRNAAIGSEKHSCSLSKALSVPATPIMDTKFSSMLSSRKFGTDSKVERLQKEREDLLACGVYKTDHPIVIELDRLLQLEKMKNQAKPAHT